MGAVGSEAAAGEPETTEQELVERADAMRPWLLDEQAATEERTFYSAELHEAFTEAGFYRLHVPRRYGGLEQSVTTFYKVIMSVSRGCPSTGWMLSLGAGHAQQAAAFYSEQAQDDFFGDGHFVASASFAYENALAIPVDGGYRIRGTWHFCSGVPYATHHMGLIPLKSSDITIDDLLVFFVPKAQFRRLDNWGDLIGLKGSGSHSVEVEETFIPAHHAVPFTDMEDGARPSVGYELHGNPLYGGRFGGFAVGRLTAVQVGNAQAATDEFERLIDGKRTVSLTMNGLLKAEEADYQRCLGLALAWTDSAYSIIVRGRRSLPRLVPARRRGRGSVHAGEDAAPLRSADDRSAALLGGGRDRLSRGEHDGRARRAAHAALLARSLRIPHERHPPARLPRGGARASASRVPRQLPLILRARGTRREPGAADRGHVAVVRSAAASDDVHAG